MNDQNNKSKENNPFTKDPFSVDVWERAYKNVGRPFEKRAFDSATQEKKSEALAFRVKATPNDTNNTAAIQKKQGGKEEAQKSKASKATVTSVSSGTTVVSPKRTTPVTKQMQKPPYDYMPGDNQPKSSAAQDQSDTPKSFLEMLENAFDEGNILDMLKNAPNLIRNAFGKRNNSDQAPFNTTWIWIVAIVIMLILFGNA